jgi:tetratricopeptide (TPR) repeat protein
MYERRGFGIARLVLAACISIPGASAATAQTACSGPPALMTRMHAHPTTETAIVLGNWFASHQQFLCAAQVFHAGLGIDSQSAQLHYLYALTLLAQRQPAEAVPELQASIHIDSSILKPHLVLASVYDGAGKHDAAALEWQKALSIDPKNEQALDGLSGDLMDAQNYSGAAALLYSAPRTEKLSIRLAQALGLSNNIDHAHAVLTQAMQLHPNSVPLARAMAVVLVRQRKFDDAIGLLQKTVDAHPDAYDAAIELYQLVVLNNFIDKARPLMVKLMAARPHDREVLYLTGMLKSAEGDNEDAKKLLEESVAIDPDFFYSRYNLGIVLLKLHEWQEAKENIEKAIALGLVDPQAHFDLARALNALGEHNQAQAELKKYEDYKRNEEIYAESTMYAGEADKYLAAGNVAEAVTAYRQAIQSSPTIAIYHYKLSTALEKNGDTADQQKQLEEAVRLDPRLSAAQAALGYLLARQGNTAGSIEHFHAAIEAAPRWADAWVDLAAEFAVSGQFPQARQAVAQALTLDPQNQRARNLNDALARDPNAQNPRP